MTETSPYRRLTDARELTALAHPVRLGIIELLSVNGPMTATELGESLGESPANCSWHLRKLAEHDFVEEAGGTGGRRRPWRVSSVGLRWHGDEATPEQRTAGRALEQLVTHRQVERYHAAVERMHTTDDGWSHAAFHWGTATWLTQAELAEVQSVIREVLGRHSERLTDPTSRPAGARVCELIAWGVPVDELAKPEE